MKKKTRCDSCRLQGSRYCRECYDFGLWTPKEVCLDAFVSSQGGT